MSFCRLRQNKYSRKCFDLLLDMVDIQLLAQTPRSSSTLRICVVTCDGFFLLGDFCYDLKNVGSYRWPTEGANGLTGQRASVFQIEEVCRGGVDERIEQTEHLC